MSIKKTTSYIDHRRWCSCAHENKMQSKYKGKKNISKWLKTSFLMTVNSLHFALYVFLLIRFVSFAFFSVRFIITMFDVLILPLSIVFIYVFFFVSTAFIRISLEQVVSCHCIWFHVLLRSKGAAKPFICI